MTGDCVQKHMDTRDNNSTRKLLTILCQGRNDSYMGNFRWRISTALNKIARNIDTLGVENEVEILVCDWGSERPLYRDLDLTQEARRIAKFLLVPPEVARIHDGDAGFSLVHPINSVARRASGRYLLFSDSDVFIPLETIAILVHFLRVGYIGSNSLDESFFWASKYQIPIQFVSRNPVLEELEENVARDWKKYPHEQISKKRFLGGGVCCLMKRDMWLESTGWDEKLIYWGWQDIDHHRRLSMKYLSGDLELHGMKMFHFQHYTKSKRTHITKSRKMNPMVEPTIYAPNPPTWGLENYSLPVVDGYGIPVDCETGDSVSRLFTIFHPSENLKSSREIIEGNPVYKEVAADFPFQDHGFFTNDGPLKAIVSALKPRTVCEIGSWLGSSARFFASFPSVEKVVCVDHWDRNRVENWTPGIHPEKMMNNLFEQFLANCAHSGLQDKVYPVRLDSVKAARYCLERGHSFDLIYIDGEHASLSVKRDIRAWRHLLSPEGLMCGDDWMWQKEPDNVAGAVLATAGEYDLKTFCHGNFWVVLNGENPIFPMVTNFMKPASADDLESHAPAGNGAIKNQLKQAIHLFKKCLQKE